MGWPTQSETAMVEVVNKETGVITQYTQADFIRKRDELLLAWKESKEALEKAKEKELEIRKQAVDFAFDPNKVKGTERIELGGGYQAKAVKKQNYGFVKNDEGKVDKEAIEKALQKIEKDGEVGLLIAERLVKWTPDLSMTEYNQLPEKYKKIIDAVIVITDGAPTLEIIEPKNK